AAPSDRRHLAEDADDDAAPARARRTGDAHRLSDDSAARRLRTHGSRAGSARAGQGARRMGARQHRPHRRGATPLRCGAGRSGGVGYFARGLSPAWKNEIWWPSGSAISDDQPPGAWLTGVTMVTPFAAKAPITSSMPPSTRSKTMI